MGPPRPLWCGPVGLSRFERRLSDVDGRLLDPEAEDTDDMTEYNRYLALLAVRGRAKTWRNPRGA